MKVDYIIVGLGLAGLAFAEELIQANKSFIVFEDDSQTSSLVAGGVYNPVILKRFSPVWNAKEQLAIALPFYEHLEKKFNTTFDQKFVIKKAFKSTEDQNNWFSAFDKPTVAPFLDDNLDENSKNLSEIVMQDFVEEINNLSVPSALMNSNNQYAQEANAQFESLKSLSTSFSSLFVIPVLDLIKSK